MFDLSISVISTNHIKCAYIKAFCVFTVGAALHRPVHALHHRGREGQHHRQSRWQQWADPVCLWGNPLDLRDQSARSSSTHGSDPLPLQEGKRPHLTFPTAGGPEAFSYHIISRCLRFPGDLPAFFRGVWASGSREKAGSFHSALGSIRRSVLLRWDR